MHCQRPDAAILKHRPQVADDFILAVPSEARLHGDGKVDGLDHLPRDREKFRDVAEHPGAGSFSRHLFHGASEIDVDQVGACLFHDSGRLDHGVGFAAVDLDGHGAFGVVDMEFAGGGADVAHESLGRDEFGIDHGGAHFAANQAKRRVGHIFHRG